MQDRPNKNCCRKERGDFNSRKRNIFESTFLLNFKEEKYEKVYQKGASLSQRLLNTKITFLNLSVTVVSFCFCLFLLIGDLGLLDFLKYESQVTVFSNQPLTKQNSGRKLRISKRLCFISFFLLLIFKGIKYWKNKGNFGIQLEFYANLFFQGMNFHIFSGIIRSYYLSNSDILILIQGVSVIFRNVVVMLYRGSWLNILITTSILIFFQTFILVTIHDKDPISLREYLLVDCVFLFFTILFAFYTDLNHRTKFYNNYKTKLEKNHLFGVLNSMQQGYYVFTLDGLLKFSNTSGENITKKYSKKSFSSTDVTRITSNTESINDYKFKYNYLKGEISDLTLLNQEIDYSQIEQGINAIYEEESCTNCSEHKEQAESNLHNYPTKTHLSNASATHTAPTYIPSRIFEETFFLMLSHLVPNKQEIGQDLYNYFINSNKGLVQFSFAEFCKYLKKDAVFFSKFTKIGVIKLQNSSNTQLDINLNDQDFFDYEVSVRICEVDLESYIEFNFTDITQILIQERKNTINQCKSNYLAKIAHEVNNPLCSILELSDEIIEQTKQQNCNALERLEKNASIFSDACYINNICHLMNYLMQDFFLTSTFNEFCVVCENITALCDSCARFLKCTTCNTCQFCYRLNNFTFFNFNDVINKCLKVFQTKCEVDKIQMNLTYVKINQSDTRFQKIKNNLDYFNSIIFNLIYHIYNKSNKNKKEVVINSKYINTSKVPSLTNKSHCFEILEYTNLSSFKYSVNTKIYTYNQYIQAKKLKNSYDKVVHLQNAYILAKKLGSDDLYLEENEGGIKYSFYVESHSGNENVEVSTGRSITSKFDLGGVNKPKEKPSKNEVNSLVSIIDYSGHLIDFDLTAVLLAKDIKSKSLKLNDKYYYKITGKSPVNTIKEEKGRKGVYESQKVVNKGVGQNLTKVFEENNVENTNNHADNQVHQVELVPSALPLRSRLLERNKNCLRETFNVDHDHHEGQKQAIVSLIEQGDSSDEGESELVNSSSEEEMVKVIDTSRKRVKKLTQPKEEESKDEESHPSGEIINQTLSKDLSRETVKFTDYKLWYLSSFTKIFEKKALKDEKVEEILGGVLIKTNKLMISGEAQTKEEANKFIDLDMISREKFLFSSTNDEQIDFRIIIVDDERIIRRGLKKFLTKFSGERKLNLEVVDCEDGVSALTAVYLYWRKNIKFDLLITDETMPYMTGSTLLSTLTRLNREQLLYSFPLVSYTSYNDSEKLNYILSQGAVEVVKKPIPYKDFVNLMVARVDGLA